ncbi:flagellar biosynthesis protein FliZ [Peribacillus cavernae]|uniref:Flagellar biosynthesis protein FliZ n=1 Tax=Peribacillus cavernae TaxID=1674310 RepID=A0A433HQ88_9BACI|nr:flagellar biosynthetic protein FliO [Peribacillus cavernae]MDQ0217064.1 flagellar protein FliO/FliZ [Peribacillus cavernae]RUQ30458.1 flagellar biosynthesis protein FliZ [Peribacillus cavernae]
MFSIKKSFQILLVVAMALFGFGGLAVHAENLDGSVKDFFEHPGKPAETKADHPDSKEKPASSKSTALTFWDFLRMVFATIFVVALLYVSLRFINKKSRTYQKANFIENIGGTTLGSNRSVQLIKVGKSILVVGVGETIQLLKEIDNQEEYRELLQDYNQKIDHLIQPGDIISKLKQRLAVPDRKTTGFASQLKKQLDEIAASRKQAIEELDEQERDRT